jgi:hypothetical protein
LDSNGEVTGVAEVGKTIVEKMEATFGGLRIRAEFIDGAIAVWIWVSNTAIPSRIPEVDYPAPEVENGSVAEEVDTLEGNTDTNTFEVHDELGESLISVEMSRIHVPRTVVGSGNIGKRVRVDVVVASQRKLKESNEAGRTIVRSQGWVFKVDVIE